jgi:hypothetical protein
VKRTGSARPAKWKLASTAVPSAGFKNLRILKLLQAGRG